MTNPNFNDAHPIPIPDSHIVMNNYPNKMTFWKGDRMDDLVGTLSWDNGVFTFEGNADESAKLFFDNLKHLFEQPKV